MPPAPDAKCLRHERSLYLPQQAGWFMRDAKPPPLIVRAKDLYDGAVPSGKAMAILVHW